MTRQSIWITADQAADLLAVSKTTIYRMMQAAMAQWAAVLKDKVGW